MSTILIGIPIDKTTSENTESYFHVHFYFPFLKNRTHGSLELTKAAVDIVNILKYE